MNSTAVVQKKAKFHVNSQPDSGDAPSSIVAGVVSRIASVVIGKSVIGSSGNPNDSYGIIAQHIVQLKVKGVKQQLETGANNYLVAQLLGGTDDVRYFELPLVPIT